MKKEKKEWKEIYEKIMRYLQSEISTKQYPPSVRQIGKALNIKSSSSTQGYIDNLVKMGYLAKDKDTARSLRILHEDYLPSNYEIADDSPFTFREEELVDIPIVGQVAAGVPILAEENIEDFFRLPIHFLPKTSNQLFILKVKGDSMMNLGILEGDYVIVSQQNTANQGDVVVALLEDSATVKTFYREKDHIRLQPENDAYEPIRTKDAVILGKVVSLFRRFV